ncbi:hypothetical protein FRC06_002866 [Ceratobasidium sp. 370]|nr:hypothetical protein FRC06_002866 [Ceratobasidium sp. 370]
MKEYGEFMAWLKEMRKAMAAMPVDDCAPKTVEDGDSDVDEDDEEQDTDNKDEEEEESDNEDKYKEGEDGEDRGDGNDQGKSKGSDRRQGAREVLHDYNVGRIALIFAMKPSVEVHVPCVMAYIERFTPIPDSPSRISGFYGVSKLLSEQGAPRIEVIAASQIARSCPLVPQAKGEAA